MTGEAEQVARVRSVCPYCGVGCGIVMDVRDGRVVKVSGDAAHPVNAGRLCTKGSSCAEPLAKGRLAGAYVRWSRKDEQIPLPMADAIRTTARRLKVIIEEHGPDAVAFYVSGQMSLEAQYLANKLAKGFIRTRHIESNSRLCMASAGAGYKLSLGADAPPGSYDDFDRTDLFLVIGANMADCHPILFLRMMDRVKAGARLIVVDPRRNATAEKAHLYLKIRPGTDLAFLNGLLHLLHEQGATDGDFIARFTSGWEEVAAQLGDYPPERVRDLTGIAEDELRAVARAIAEARAGNGFVTCWTMGLNQSSHGTANVNAVVNLHLATGEICKPGRGPFSLTGQPNAMGGREMGYMGPGLPGQRSLLSDADRAFTEARWGLSPGSLTAQKTGGTLALFEEMKAGGVKACWIICTNPVASVANRQVVIDALKAAELVVVQDAFLDTETNVYADVLLPGALWAEADGVLVNSERTLTLSAKAVEPPGEAMADWRIIAQVACEMGYGADFSYASGAEVFEEIKGFSNPATGYDLAGASHARLAGGPLQWPVAAEGPARNPIRYLNDGVHMPRLAAADGSVPELAFPTPDGRARFVPAPFVPAAEQADDDFPFLLNTGRLQHQWHTLTKTGKVATLNKLNPGPFLELNPADAERLDVGPADLVEVRSRRGRAVLPASLSERVAPGQCFAPFHWNDVFGDALAINAVTSDAIDPVSQQPEFKVAAVALTRVAAAPRPVEARTGAEARAVGRVNGACATTLASLRCLDDQGAPLSSVLTAFADIAGLAPTAKLELAAEERAYLQGFLAGLAVQPPGAGDGVPVLPPGAPVGRQTRLLVDGLLAGLFSRVPGGAAPLPAPSGQTVTLAFASQTGRAEAAAEAIAGSLREGGLAVRLAGLDALDPAELSGAGTVLFVVSTFGDGDPPDAATAFWARLTAPEMPALPDLGFSVLAFGDSSYAQFCGFGRALDARLEALGAKRVAPRIDCEPDYEDDAARWQAAVAQALAVKPAPAGASTRVKDGAAPAYGRTHPFPARLVLNRVLNAPGSGKETRQIGLAIGELAYEAGDALGVMPRNCPHLVQEILGLLGLDGAEPVGVGRGEELPLAEALASRFEIARITPDLLGWWSKVSADETLAGLLAGERAALDGWLYGKQAADLFRRAPRKVASADLLGALKKLQPRLYSIASSPRATPGEVQLTVSTVRYLCEGRPRGGVASTFLADRAGEGEVPVFIQSSPHFRVPKDGARPIVMIGPGTGIAPFRAFLQERALGGARGANWLFFGEQHRASDFYYREELEDWAKSGHLTRLDTAFSRDQAAKVYVQDRMREAGAELWRWLQEGAHVYVCGDAARMAKDVDRALVEVVATHGAMAADAARAYVAEMATNKRYVRDVY